MCEHSPFNCIHADFLYELFPGMKLVYVYRDPRDVVSSYLTRRWVPSESIDAAIWLKQILEQKDEAKETLPQSTYTEVKFEDLMANPPGMVSEICKFLGVPFEAEMVALDLSRHHMHRWKQDLTKKQAEEVSEIAWPFIEQHGA